MYRFNRIAPIPHPFDPTRADSGRQHPDAGTRRHELKVQPGRIAAAVSSLASEILAGIPGQVDGAAVLDGLRRRLNATHAVLWISDSQGSRRVLVAGGGPAAQASPSLEFDHGGVAIRRLRRAGTVLCRLGEVTGFEDLMPAGEHSFVVAAGTFGDDCTPVIRPLAVAAAESYVGLARAKKIEVKLVSETDVREYEIFVDGPEFTVNGQTFPNDWTYVAELDNDSSFKCLVNAFHLK